MALNHESPDSDRDCGVAFKEWAGVCDALGSGRQTILLRKGGIREDGGIFRPEHPRFWLYPTNVHEGQQGIRHDRESRAMQEAGSIAFELLAEVDSARRVDRIEAVLQLSDYHVWTEETIRKRFEYRNPGLWVLPIRVYRLASPVVVPELPEYSGCKTWVNLDRAIPMGGLRPVLDEREAMGRRGSLESALIL